MLSDFLKFGLICCCFINSLAIGGGKDSHLLQVAMLFTVFADFQMVILKNNELGILFFCIVQLIYSLRYGGRLYLSSIMKYFIPWAALLILLDLKPLYLFALIYTGLFCFSLLAVFRSKYSWPNSILVKAGMVLFALCDINVALANNSLWFLSEYRGLFSSLIWIFYLPAQIMLSFSSYRYVKE